MKTPTASEEKARDHYEHFWSIRLQRSDKDLMNGCHYGFYEKGIINSEEATRNMNDFVGRLLGLDNEREIKILDAGCGAGATSLYLAKKYPNVNFTGITITPKEVELATKVQKEKNVNNAKFILGSYINTGFSNSNFDGAFALESVCYAQSKKDFVHEMYRILKPGGRLIVIDGFRTDIPFSYFMQKIYDLWRKRRGNPDLESLKAFNSYLEIEGFKEINIRNLSKNIANYFIYGGFFASFFGFLNSGFKKIIKDRKDKPEKDFEELLKGTNFVEFLLGLSKKTGYYAITAIKKYNMGDNI